MKISNVVLGALAVGVATAAENSSNKTSTSTHKNAAVAPAQNAYAAGAAGAVVAGALAFLI